MVIYSIILIIIIILWGLSKFEPQSKIVSLFCIVIIMITISSLKYFTVGTDTLTYYNLFILIDYYVDDRAYAGLQRLWYYFSLIWGGNYDLFMIGCYSISFVGTAYLIRKRSNDMIFSILLFYLMFFPLSLNIMRQFISLGIYCVGLVYLSEHKPWKYLILTIIAASFHFSALIMFPLAFIAKLSMNKKWVISLIAVSFIIGFSSNLMTPIVKTLTIVSILNDGAMSYIENFGQNSNRNIVTNGITNIVFVVSFIMSKNKNDIFLKQWFLFILFTNLVGNAGQGSRILLYLFIGYIIAAPNIFYEIKSNTLRFSYLTFILGYSIGYWYILLSSGAGEVIPYSFR